MRLKYYPQQAQKHTQRFISTVLLEQIILVVFKATNVSIRYKGQQVCVWCEG